MKKLAPIAIAVVVMMLVLGVASTAFAATITQLPNIDGTTWAKGSVHIISWTSSGLAAGDTLTLVLEPSDGNGPTVFSQGGLAQNGSLSWTVPSTVVIGTDYTLYLVNVAQDTYSDSTQNWVLRFKAAAVNSAASSEWSLALLALVGLGVGGVAIGRRRIS